MYSKQKNKKDLTEISKKLKNHKENYYYQSSNFKRQRRNKDKLKIVKY